MKKRIAIGGFLAAAVLLAGCTGGDNANQSDVEENPETQAGQSVEVLNPDGTPATAESSGVVSGITLEEVAKHASKDDCWMAIDGKVYDVTSFVAQHPGGDEILRGCGIDATAAFNGEQGGHSHSSSADLKKEEFLKGDLAQ